MRRGLRHEAEQQLGLLLVIDPELDRPGIGRVAHIKATWFATFWEVALRAKEFFFMTEVGSTRTTNNHEEALLLVDMDL
ncbi:hypothetical protein [Pseudoroseomonas sp. WGS1072]|uniref:hypothetical protein n=1 Tax=Roseomonas sp. WGS1072 TaxID=3366816 RepID=UPI003BF2C0DF